MHDDGLDIPDFLRRQPGDPKVKWKPAKKVKERKAKRHPFNLPRTMESASWALLKQIEAEKKAKRDARFAALRELRKRR